MVVVPANAGTHTPRPRRFGTVANGFCSNTLLWLWVLAFARTTIVWRAHAQRITSDSIFNSFIRRHSFAISPRLRASFTGSVLPSKFRGRRECQAPEAPAASHAK